MLRQQSEHQAVLAVCILLPDLAFTGSSHKVQNHNYHAFGISVAGVCWILDQAEQGIFVI